MVSQAKGGCKVCKSMDHTAVYHNRKPIKRSAIKLTKDKAWVKPIIKAKPIKKKTKTRSWYVKELDRVFSIFIRQKYATDGMTACVTCGAVKRWQEQQNGHYMSRGHLPTRWSEDNCAPQCYACNVMRKGNYVEYSLWMINTYGVEKLEELKRRANSGVKITTVEIKEMIEKYKKLIAEY